MDIKVKYFTQIDQLEMLSQEERTKLDKVTDSYSFRCNEYYASLIDFDDPQDPIRRLIVPHEDELIQWGRPDPSDESECTVLPGVEHKYNSTVLLLVSDICEGICRYCFRKRVFDRKRDEILYDIDAAMQYIRSRPEVTNVLITGGDPFVLSTDKLGDILRRLREIDHVQIIRIGTRMPVFNPYRIIEDPSLAEMISHFSLPQKKIYIMTHFMHRRELSDVAIKGLDILQRADAIITNQMPLIRGINDDPEVLAELLAKLSFVGAVPYYVFQCRPAMGNRAYTVPIEEGYAIVEKAKSMVSGLAKRIRFVMSHSSGKLEILGPCGEQFLFRYHRAADDRDSGKILAFQSNPQAYWLDDYAEMVESYSSDRPYRYHGPE